MIDGDGAVGICVFPCSVNIMFLKFLPPYISLISLLDGHHILAIEPVQRRFKVYGFGLPPVHVNVSIETIPVKGIIRYDMLYNRTCCDSCFDSEMKSPCEANVSPLDKCHFVENQGNLHTKFLSCTICNSMENCKSMAVEEDNDLCLCLKAVNVSSGELISRLKCRQQRYRDLIVYPPPKSIQLFTTAKRSWLTVSWERPDGLALNISAELKYHVLLQMQNHGHNKGSCKKVLRYGNHGQVHNYTFYGLIPWTNYSVTICCGVNNHKGLVNMSSCTCGGANFPQYTPAGPIFQRTSPAEPTEAPQLQPCKAMCHGDYLTATLQWQASNQQVWNGIPTKSVITIWNSSASDAEGNKLGFPATPLSVPLPEGYNGSLISHTIYNLSSAATYKVQFCSNGGCGPAAQGTLSCENCLIVPGPSPTKHDPGKSHKSSLTIKVFVSCFLSVVTVGSAYSAWLFLKRKKSRERIARTPLNEVLSDLSPDDYDEIDSSDLASDSGPYRQVIVSDRQCLVAPNQTGEPV